MSSKSWGRHTEQGVKASSHEDWSSLVLLRICLCSWACSGHSGNWKQHWLPKWALLNIREIIGSIGRFMTISLSFRTVPSTWLEFNKYLQNEWEVFFLNIYPFAEGTKVSYQHLLFSWVKTGQPTGSHWLLRTFNVFIHPYSFLHHPSSFPPQWVAGRTLKHSLSIMSFSFHFEYMLFCCPDSQMSSLFSWDSSSYAIRPELFQSTKTVYP